MGRNSCERQLGPFRILGAMVSLPPAGIASRAFTHQIQKNLFDLTLVCLDSSEPRIEDRREFDIFSDDPFEHLFRLEMHAFSFEDFGSRTC